MSPENQELTPESTTAPEVLALAALPPFKERIRALWHACSPFERVLVTVLSATFILAACAMLQTLNNAFTVAMPAEGGSLTEGMIGSPRFVNPVLAVSETDRALTSLIYSGLMKESVSGTLAPDLAESYELSPDGKKYTFILKSGATFHNDTPITIDDIMFTIEKTRDPVIKSPHRADWEGVTIEKKDERTIVFSLQKPYALFLHNTTIGVLPRAEWKDLTSEEFAFSNKNIAPIGSGPYAFVSVTDNAQGIPASYALHSFAKYAGHHAYISDVHINFYHSAPDALTALNGGYIEALGGLSSSEAAKVAQTYPHLIRATLPRVFALFYNQIKSLPLADLSVRTALNTAVNQHEIIKEVFSDFALPLNGPQPSDVIITTMTSADRVRVAQKILDDAGWKMNETTTVRIKDEKELTLSIATANTHELKEVAQRVADAWRLIGVKVKVELFEPGDLNQLVLRPRAFDVLLFGEITGREPDLFAFWHSSQKTDPGLNVAQYQNKKADALLEQARSTNYGSERTEAYAAFADMVRNDVPATFLYAPQYVYALPEDVLGATFAPVMEPYERFSSITEWYRESERVWSIFVEKKEQPQQ